MDGDRGLHLVWSLVDLACFTAIVGGAFAAVAGWRPAAWILVSALACQVGTHVLLSAVAYRRTMGRPWPEVRPLPDDEDDW